MYKKFREVFQKNSKGDLKKLTNLENISIIKFGIMPKWVSEKLKENLKCVSRW